MNQSSSATNLGSSRFVRACLRQPVDRTPVWFLRQAGRYMAEYMAVRKHHSLLDICRTPEIAAEVTITAAERLGVDAAIIFADLLLPLTPMGLDFDFIAGEGPVVRTPLRTEEQVRALRTDRVDDLQYVARAIEKVVAHFALKGPGSNPALNGPGFSPADQTHPQTGASAPEVASQDQLGIIGFIGAPFTLASYMIEGGSSRNYIEAKRMMYASGLPISTKPLQTATNLRHPERSERPLYSVAPGTQPSATAAPSEPSALDPGPSKSPWALGPAPSSACWPILMEKLVDILSAYAQQQVEAGADVIQIFDSWAGALSVQDYRQYCLAPTTELVRRVRAMGVPVIYFGVDTASLLPAMRETGADVLGLDWRIPLDEGWRAVGSGCAVQGNLDPIALFAPEDVLRDRVHEVLHLAAGRPGHIFNLGHGIVPETSVDSVLNVVKWVKEFDSPVAPK